MRLADLIDLEWQIHSDARTDDPTGVRVRDRTMGPEVLAEAGEKDDATAARHRIAREGAFRRQVCLAWLTQLRRKRDHGLPGERIALGFRAAAWVLAILGLLMGSGAAKAFLAYDGSEPVNVLTFGVFFFGLQVLLLLVLVLVLSWPKRQRQLSLVHRIVASLATVRWLDRLLGGGAARAAAAMGEMRGLQGLYGDLERWQLFRAMQWFGVAFNLGAVVTCLLLVAFSDLAFSWSTTLELGGDGMHGLVSAVSAPWGFVDAAVPSAEVVEKSQWVRMEKAFAGGHKIADSLENSARWWKFLLAGLVVYGLLPRFVALMFGQWRCHRLLRRPGLDHAGYQRLYERLLSHVTWHGPTPESVSGPAPVPKGSAAPRPTADPAAARWLLVWGRLGQWLPELARHQEEKGHTVTEIHAVGGADLAADDVALSTMRAAAPGWLTVVFESGNQPTKEVLAFLRSARGSLTPETAIAVQLVEEQGDATFAMADAQEREAWDRSLRAEGDPYLWLEDAEAGS